MRQTGIVTLLLSSLALSCASASTPAPHAPGSQVVREGGFANAGEARLFDETVEKNRDMTYPQLLAKLRVGASAPTGISFDPTQARYFDEVSKALQMTPAERAIFAKTGVVSVDHQQAYSMGSAYYAIYTRDLPVLVTTDSILHALHRSYDKALSTLETAILGSEIDTALRVAHEALADELGTAKDDSVRQSLGDVDLYLTVARSLLAAQEVRSVAGQNDEASELLSLIRAKKFEKTKIYGGMRVVDFSQFVPRGHYTESEYLKRYFLCMMWLGRADLGFNLMPPHPNSGMDIDVERERRNAAVMALLLEKSGAMQRLTKVSNVIDFMVGSGDDLSPAGMGAVLAEANLASVADLASADAANRLGTAIETNKSGNQQIRSQHIESNRYDTIQVPPPALFQVFGQRFILDSFVLSKLVYDSILFENVKQQRMMPKGLDVMAAFGNDEALRLLEPDVKQHKYAANIFAAREVVRSYRPAQWDASVYNLWLDTLRTLDDPPEGHLPTVMRTQPWQRKQLQTQLGSWAELRHDTILYGKQSYTAAIACEYPEGFVEPYPEFYVRVARTAARASELIGGIDVDANKQHIRDMQAEFFKRFAETVTKLEALARKELAATPFSSDEEEFLKKVIDIRGGGSGPPRYDGWYPKLIYGGEPAKWKPTIADVHTDPESKTALHVGTGNTQLLVVAVDNEEDRTVYVGPAFSYYEFASSRRLTDEDWQQQLRSGSIPERPSWSSVFTAPPVQRHLNR